MDFMPQIARQWHERLRRRMARVVGTAPLRQSTSGPALHQELLVVARRLASQGEHRAAVVIAQTACEVLTEQVIRHLLELARAKALKDWALDVIGNRNFNLDNERVRKLYVALSDDRIMDRSLWAPYQAHVRLRHRVAHRGELPSEGEAKASCDAAGALLEHLEPLLSRNE
jgi:hypothetical protein